VDLVLSDRYEVIDSHFKEKAVRKMHGIKSK